MGVLLGRKDVSNLRKRREFNGVLADYYGSLSADFLENDYGVSFGSGNKYKNDKKLVDFFRQKSFSVRGCYNHMELQRFDVQGKTLKDIVKVITCKDRFCMNCQCLMADLRQAKYRPVVESYAHDYSLWHVVFTVPNCDFEEIQGVLDKMTSSFRHLIRFFDGSKKVRGVDFLQFGYAGAIRSLEITFNNKTKQFHPHFHCIFALKKGLTFNPDIINSFSRSRKNSDIRKFSFFEVLLQKVWKLLFLGVPVTSDNISKLNEGYSVSVTDGLGSIQEVFKYALKSTVDIESGDIFSYDAFKYLWFAMYNRRILQPYGCFYHLDFEDVSSDVAIQLYLLIRRVLGVKVSNYCNSLSSEERFGFWLKEIEKAKKQATFLGKNVFIPKFKEVPDGVSAVENENFETFLKNNCLGHKYFSKSTVKKEFFDSIKDEYEKVPDDQKEFYLNVKASKIVVEMLSDSEHISMYNI